MQYIIKVFFIEKQVRPAYPRGAEKQFNMPENQNNPPEETRADPAGKSEVAQTPPSVETTESSASAPASGGLKPKLKKLWGYVNAFLEYVDEEAPPKPRDPNVPESKLKKGWRRFNAFLDALEAEEPAPRQPAEEKTFRESVRDFKSRWYDDESRRKMLRKAGSVCWTLFFLGMIVIFFFVLTVYGTVRALDYIDANRVLLYPSDEVMRFVAAEHETLEKTACPLTTVQGKCEDIPLDRFDEKCREALKPLKIYSDEYGVYLVTGKDWYSGEHGIFIARDEEKMPPALTWAWLEGRVFAYGIFD